MNKLKTHLKIFFLPFCFFVLPTFALAQAALSVAPSSGTYKVGELFSVLIQLKEPVEKEESKNIIQKEISLLEHVSSPILFLFLSTFIVSFMFGGIDAILAIYTSKILGFTSTDIGIVFTYIGFLIMAMQFIGGNLVNRFGELKLINAGFIISGLGFYLLTFTTSWITLLIPLGIFVAGNVLVFPSVNSLITKKVTGKRGAVLGLTSSFQSLGQIIGPLTGGILFTFSHTLPFLVMAIVIWIYAIIFFFIGRKKLATPIVENNASPQ